MMVYSTVWLNAHGAGHSQCLCRYNNSRKMAKVISENGFAASRRFPNSHFWVR